MASRRTAKPQAAASSRKTTAVSTRRKPVKATARRKPANRAATRASFEKAEGNLPVQAYLTSLPAWQRDAARRFDALVVREVPHVRKAVKWSSALYGVPGLGWFAAVKGFNKHVKFTFFKGTSLKPVPPAGESQEMRALDLRETDSFDEERMAKWVRQASAIPGWGS